MVRALVTFGLVLTGCNLVLPLERQPPQDQSGDWSRADFSTDSSWDQDSPLDHRPWPFDLSDTTQPPDGQLSPDLKPVPGTWVTISPGGFTMGSQTGELCLDKRRFDTKETPHKVTLSGAFDIQTTEVTQAQFEPLMGYNPTTWSSCGGGCPVDKVNWHEAAAYCNALSTLQGLSSCYQCKGPGDTVICDEVPTFAGKKIYHCPGYRLPTEAEWEYAYRAGTQTSFYNGAISDCSIDPKADAIGWYKTTGKLKPAGGKVPNGWGLYDMAGSLWEWCHDWGKANLTVATDTDPLVTKSQGTGAHPVRGGSWGSDAHKLRAAYREFIDPTSRGGTNGFRCVRSR